MNPIMLRQLWALIENTQPNALLEQDDSSLVEGLLAQLEKSRSLNEQETENIVNYIRSKTALIRDLADQRS